MSNKKAIEMATSTIIAIVLGLIILIILIIFAQQQVSKSGKKLDVISEEADIAPNKCASLVMGRYCVKSGECKDKSGADKTITTPAGGWLDCGKDPSDKPDCCSRF